MARAESAVHAMHGLTRVMRALLISESKNPKMEGPLNDEVSFLKRGLGAC